MTYGYTLIKIKLKLIMSVGFHFKSLMKSNCRKSKEFRVYFSSSSTLNEMITSSFIYYLLIWMFWSRKSNHLINKLQKNYLRIISENRKSNFEMVLENRKNSQFTKELLKYTLMGKADKILIGNAPAIIKSVFVFWENICNNWSFQVISNINKNTMRYGLETRVKEHLFIGPIYYRH